MLFFSYTVRKKEAVKIHFSRPNEPDPEALLSVSYLAYLHISRGEGNWTAAVFCFP